MIKREANFGLRFRHWYRSIPPINATWELKDCSKKTAFPFEEWKEPQRDWAAAIQGEKGVLMRQQGGSGEPDYTSHVAQPAYVVINFKDGFCVIDSAVLLNEIKTSDRKSLTHERAKLISVYNI